MVLQQKVVYDVPTHRRFQELRTPHDSPLQILTRRQGPPESSAYKRQTHRQGIQMKQSSLGLHVSKGWTTSFLKTLTSRKNSKNPMCVGGDDEPWTISTDAGIPDLPDWSVRSYRWIGIGKNLAPEPFLSLKSILCFISQQIQRGAIRKLRPISSFDDPPEPGGYVLTVPEQILVDHLRIAPKVASRTDIMHAAKISFCLGHF